MKRPIHFLAAGLLAAALSFVSCNKSEIDDLNKRVDDLSDKIEQLTGGSASTIPGLQTEINALKAIVESYNNELKANLQANYDDQSARYNELLAKYNELNAALSAAKAELQNKLDALSNSDANLQNKIDAAVNDYNAKINAAVADFNASLDELATRNDLQDVAIANLQALCKEMVKGTDFQAYVDEMDSIINGIRTRLTEAEAALIELNDNIIPALKARIAAAEAAIKNLSDDIQLLKEWRATTDDAISSIQAVLDALSKTYLSKEDFNLWTAWAVDQFASAQGLNDLQTLFNQFKELALNRMDTLEASIIAHGETLDAAYDALVEADNALAAQIEALLGKFDALEEVVNANTSALSTLTGRFNNAEERIFNLEDDLKTQVTNLSNDIINARNAAIAHSDDNKAEVLKALYDALDEAKAYADQILEDAKDYTDEMIASLDAAIQNLLDEIEMSVMHLQEDVSQLISRTQSVVFVPQYNDGGASIEYAKYPYYQGVLNEEMAQYLPCKTDLYYEVRPAENAWKIADAYQWGKLDVDFVLTRTESRASSVTGVIDHLKIVDIQPEGASQIRVTVEAEGLNKRFFTDPDYRFAAALSFRERAYQGYSPENLEDFTTAFVPFSPGREKVLRRAMSALGEIQKEDSGEETILAVRSGEYFEMDYRSTENIWVNENREPVFYFDDDKSHYYTGKQLEDLGYFIGWRFSCARDLEWWDEMTTTPADPWVEYRFWWTWSQYTGDVWMGLNDSYDEEARHEVAGYVFRLRCDYIISMNNVDQDVVTQSCQLTITAPDVPRP